MAYPGQVKKYQNKTRPCSTGHPGGGGEGAGGGGPQIGGTYMIYIYRSSIVNQHFITKQIFLKDFSRLDTFRVVRLVIFIIN